MANNHFGRELERLRKKKAATSGERWTQKKVAETIGVTAQAYQNWMHGRRGKDIDLSMLKKLAGVLDGDFRLLVKLARPDVFKHVSELVGDWQQKLKDAECAEAYPPKVGYLADILKELHLSDAVKFKKAAKAVQECCPDTTARVRKKTARKRRSRPSA